MLATNSESTEIARPCVTCLCDLMENIELLGSITGSRGERRSFVAHVMLFAAPMKGTGFSVHVGVLTLYFALAFSPRYAFPERPLCAAYVDGLGFVYYDHHFAAASTYFYISSRPSVTSGSPHWWHTWSRRNAYAS